MKRKLTTGLLFALVIFGLTSCLTQKKREDITYRFLRENPLAASGFCAQAFPPKDTTVKTETHKADNKDYSAPLDDLAARVMQLHVKMELDSANAAAGKQISAQDVEYYKSQVLGLQKQANGLKRAYVPCKPDTVTNTVYRENTAKVDNLNLTLQALKSAQDKLQTKYEEEAAKAKRFIWLFICLSAAVLALVYFLFKK